MRDATGRGRSFEINQTGEALVFGAASPLRVTAPGVLPAHFVVLPHDGVLVAASASPMKPAVLNGAPLPTTWTVLEVPSRIRIGAAAVDFFYVRERGATRGDQDVEITVADTGPHRMPPQARGVTDSTRLGAAPRAVRLLTPPRALPLVTTPPMRTRPRLVPTPPQQRAANTPRDVAIAAMTYARLLWQASSMSTRVLLGVVAVLLTFLVARSGRASAPPVQATSDASQGTSIPSGVPVLTAVDGR